MAFTQNSTALYNDLSSYYTSFNNFIQNYGGSIAKLTVPGANSAIAASNINNLNSKINEFKNDTFLKTETNLWVPAANVTAGNIIYASNWTNISTTVSNFSVVKCRNTATNTYGTVACNPQSCGSQGSCNRTCSQSCQYGSNGNNSCNNNCNKACSTNGANGNNSCNNTCNKGCNPNSCSSQGTCNKTCSSQTCNPNSCSSQGSCNQTCNSQSCGSNGTYGYIYGVNSSGTFVWQRVSSDDRRAAYTQNNNTSGLSSCSVTCSRSPTHQSSNRIAGTCSVTCNLTCGSKGCSANGANGNSSCNNACNKGCTSNGANGNSSCNNTCSSQGCNPNACSSQGTCNQTCSSQGCNPNACSSQGTCGKTCSQSCNPYSSNSNSSCNYGTKTCTSQGTTIDIRNSKTTMTKT